MSREEVRRAIRDYVVKEFLPGEDPASLTSDTKLFSDGILDSLASLKLVSYLEEQFGVTIEAHEVDVDHLDTLDTIADMIIGKAR